MVDKASYTKEIKARLPLSAIIGERVALRGRSPRFSGLCPFHDEKTPSFHVRDNVARFKCFGCGASGDVFEFVMRLRGLSFAEAVEELAVKAGIVRLKKTDRAVTTSKEKDVLLAAQKRAQEYFVAQLRASSVATSYVLCERGLSERMIKQAGIGFGGVDKQQYLNFFKGISNEVLLEAGLLKQGRYSLVPSFVNRITFPIRTTEGHIVAFGGRAFLDVDNQSPKYVNTHSYRHYEKRKSFYGWFESRAAMQKGVTPIVVEGYFDAMAMWALGRPALALCGTALTVEHLKLLRTLSSRVLLCFDKDSAGINALRQALALVYSMNIEPSLIILDEKDAGDYLRKKNLDGLKKRLDAATDAMCYLIDQAAIVAQESVSERVRQIDALLPIFASMKRILVRRQYAAYLAKKLHEEPAVIWSEIAHKFIPTRPQERNGSLSPMRMPLAPHDRLALEIAWSDPALITTMGAIVDHLSSDVKGLLKTFSRYYEESPHVPIELLIEKTLHDVDAHWLPMVRAIVQNRIMLTPEEARTSLTALEDKLGLQSQRASLKKKRLELESFWRKRDYPSVLSSLREKSELLASRKSAHKSMPRISVGIQQPPVADERIKDQKINDLDPHGSFFDAAEDW